jgi:hypothetical protein
VWVFTLGADGELKPIEVIDFGVAARDVLRVDVLGSPPVWILLALEGDEDEGRWVVVGADAAGKQLWQWRPKPAPSYLKPSLALLYDERGPFGVAVHERGGTLTGLGLAGEVLWSEEIPASWRLETHPRLPGVFLLSGSRAFLGRYARGGAEGPHGYRGEFWPRRALDLSLSIDRAALSVSAGTTPLVIIAAVKRAEGADEHGAPCLLSTGRDGLPRWRAWLPARALGLAIVEPKDAPRLIVVTTEKGELLIVGEDGALRWRGDVPRETLHGLHFGGIQRGIAAGALGVREWGVAVQALQGWVLYRVHLDALASTK